MIFLRKFNFIELESSSKWKVVVAVGAPLGGVLMLVSAAYYFKLIKIKSKAKQANTYKLKSVEVVNSPTYETFPMSPTSPEAN